ncbi:hypothetical protein Micbo1qcDRAFT_164826 [Microdochium bolleyi]|uniref:Uncharacterized protein n=1 Tax=Microdochium bolleyi TaxID=196109 RepID=A0A136IZ76_9PEZI|nr:hypothetical protein Micbo1qcDRAFT_164826 [Microdochium bolleyi]
MGVKKVVMPRVTESARIVLLLHAAACLSLRATTSLRNDAWTSSSASTTNSHLPELDRSRPRHSSGGSSNPNRH